MPGICRSTLIACLMLLAVDAHAQVKLGASALATYVDDEGEPAKLNSIVTEAFRRMDEPLELQVMRRAFLGSALSSGQVDGEFAFTSLDKQAADKLYSQSYLPLRLYAASKRPAVTEIRLIPQLKDARIAIENQFANTDDIRAIREVKWSRNPTTYDAFRQFADDRAPMLMTTALLIDEFNRLLVADNEEPVMRSAAPLVSRGFYLSLSKTDNNQALLKKFNRTIADMQEDGTYNELLGLSWLTKDINNDGVADFITSNKVIHRQDPAALQHAYPLDNYAPGEASIFIVNGQQFTSVKEAESAVKYEENLYRASFLDPDVYKDILRKW